MRTVAALYVEPKGPYLGMAGVELWTYRRNAKLYAGEHPVVAHPPCGPWGRLKFLNKHQDPTCGLLAVDQVRLHGGVLEHPEHSTLFKVRELPKPSAPPDSFGGRTYRVDQSGWGHRCKKATWLYVVGVDHALVLMGIRSPIAPTHRVTNGSRGDTTLPRVGALEARLSPPEFAAWLISLARAAQM